MVYHMVRQGCLAVERILAEALDKVGRNRPAQEIPRWLQNLQWFFKQTKTLRQSTHSKKLRSPLFNAELLLDCCNLSDRICIAKLPKMRPGKLKHVKWIEMDSNGNSCIEMIWAQFSWSCMGSDCCVVSICTAGVYFLRDFVARITDVWGPMSVSAPSTARIFFFEAGQRCSWP